MDELLTSSGYLATASATFLQGEILYLTAVLAAKLNEANYAGILAAAFVGAYARDWLIFLLARKRGRRFIEKRQSWAAKLQRAQGWLEQHPIKLLLAYRMIYGFSTIVILLSGVSQLTALRYGILTGIGCLIWVGFYGILGWFFADAVIRHLTIISHYANHAMVAVFFLLLIYWLLKKYRAKERDALSDVQ